MVLIEIQPDGLERCTKSKFGEAERDDTREGVESRRGIESRGVEIERGVEMERGEEVLERGDWVGLCNGLDENFNLVSNSAEE